MTKLEQSKHTLEDLNPARAYRNPTLSPCGCEKILVGFFYSRKKHGKVNVFASLLSLLPRTSQIIMLILTKPSTVNEPVEKKSF